ncbi:GIY-YIG nuclease family protein [Mycobacteroides salmoniphilum]|uniref:GIY-YIG catalytic domain protein n=1 Tax=Mycobacteroides salmoniphilum TaxID=404941 RepID=A0A4R8SC37_9MYCO|nr:GIY-YIG catalytic domain protein [Mycobacteroides salmoniphilum]TEA07399.1 GIY-YIG catalytic domain protein [Mycobacteroides salmoniphilum]
MPDPAVIYALCDPTSGEVRYIGKTIDVRARLRSHLWDSRNPKEHTHKARWIRSLKSPPVLEIIETLSDADDWAERECYWIAKYRSEGARLTNLTNGGDGWSSNGHTDETKARLREMALARGAKPPSQSGRKASPETRKKLQISARERGVKPPPSGGWNKGRRKTHCVNGHELTAETRYCLNGRYRGCKLCMRESSRRHSRSRNKLSD